MQLTSFSFEADAGWSTETLPDLDSSNTLVLVFAAPKMRENVEPISRIRGAYPNSIIVGCSTSGEIFHDEVRDESLSVAVVRFEKTALKVAYADIQAGDESESAGKSLAEQLRDPALKGVLVLSDGLNVNGTDLVRGINAALGDGVIVTGGLAGDGSDFSSTWILGDAGPVSGKICAVGLYGDHIRIGHGSQGGWDKFGPERRVTRASDNVLYELDGQPALDLYKQYLGDRASGLPATGLLFPLALKNEGEEKSLVRTILAVDEDNNSLTFAGDIPQGTSVQLMKANFDRLVEGAEGAAPKTKNRGGDDGPVLAVAISCVGRRLVLGERTEEEVEATLEVLPEDTVQVGFYSYGELSPYASGPCDLHNQTMTLTTYHEA